VEFLYELYYGRAIGCDVVLASGFAEKLCIVGGNKVDAEGNLMYIGKSELTDHGYELAVIRYIVEF